MSISLVFNVANLFSYRGIFEPLVLPSVSACMSSTLVPRAPSTALESSDEILVVLNDEFVTSRSDSYRHFFVRWKDCPSTYDAWITQEEFFSS